MTESGRKEKKLNLTFYFVAGSIIRINEGPELIASHADSSHQQSYSVIGHMKPELQSIPEVNPGPLLGRRSSQGL